MYTARIPTLLGHHCQHSSLQLRPREIDLLHKPTSVLTVAVY